MQHEYTHIEPGTYVDAPSGYYTPTEEGRLPFHGKEVFYVVGETHVEASCCGVGCFRYVQVPGYVVAWKVRKNENDLFMSEVESITDEAARSEVRSILQQKYSCAMIEFF